MWSIPNFQHIIKSFWSSISTKLALKSGVEEFFAFNGILSNGSASLSITRSQLMFFMYLDWHGSNERVVCSSHFPETISVILFKQHLYSSCLKILQRDRFSFRIRAAKNYC